MKITDIDRGAIRSVIERQLEAFHRDDGEVAFACASPDIQIRFGKGKQFINMVKIDYFPLYHPRAVIFEELTILEGFPAQDVLLMDEKGDIYQAIYFMQLQSDGSWRIHGCFLNCRKN